MSTRINTNVSSLNAHRNVMRNQEAQGKTLERLASGLKINQGADAPAQLQISEQLRAQSAGLNQAIDNSEMAVSLMQTAEAALDEVSRALINARQITVHAANEATNDEFMLQADQQELDNILSSINRIAANTQYGKNNLLDGSKAGNGVTSGENLEFLEAGANAQTSGPGGYVVGIQQSARQAVVAGGKQLNQGLIDAGEQITITEGGRTLDFQTQTGRTVEQTLNDLGASIKDAGLNLKLLRPDPSTTKASDPQAILLQHKEYGNKHTFTVASSTAGVLSTKAGISDLVDNGADVKGTINGEAASGRGQVLTGAHGSGSVEGIQVRYTGTQQGPDDGATVGTLTFSQNSLVFQIGGNAGQTASISMKSMRATQLGSGVQNDSGFRSLGQVNVRNSQGAQDSMRVIDRAIEEVAVARGEMGAFQRNSVESNLNYLRIAHENVLSSESVIRDADIAKEMAAFTRNQIMVESSTAMLAQANQQHMNVLNLVR